MVSIPNIITFFRFILIPVFVGFYTSDTKYGRIIATGIFILAGLSDVIDGYIARRFKMVTPLGEALDPLADKMIFITALLCLTLYNVIDTWIFFAYLAKEIVMVIYGFYMISKERYIIPSKWFGKLATVLFFVSVVVSLPFSDISVNLVRVLYIISLVFALFAFINYLSLYLKYYKNKNTINDNNKDTI